MPPKKKSSSSTASSQLLALEIARRQPPAPPAPAADGISQADAWAAEPDWDELTQAEQLQHLQADVDELHRRMATIRNQGPGDGVPHITASRADPQAG